MAKNQLINAINIDTLQINQRPNNNNVAFTTNCAVSNKSTQDAILDFFYHGPAMRGKNVSDIIYNAFNWDIKDAIATMFYIRDVRGGAGERDVFHQALTILRANRHDLFDKVVGLVPEYGYWKDIVKFVDEPVVVNAVREQLHIDQLTTKPSLCAKWMPSENASSKETRSLARKWCAALGTTLRNYRQMLTKLRAKLNVVERDMSAQRWTTIKYETVSSKANKRYAKAFGKHDFTRYNEFLNAVIKGDKKMNADTLYPYEILRPLFYGDSDKSLEALWKSLPNYAGDKSVMVVCDTSGSMMSGGSGDIKPIHVAVSLAMYFAERNKGPFKDHFITFSTTPKLVEIVGKTLYDRVYNIAHRSDWGGSTDIQAVFNLVLSNAIKHRVPADDMPASITIISDMQFNPYGYNTNLAGIKQKYINAGYALPQIIFWNVNSGGKETPAKMNESGVVLVSGASANVFKSILNSISTNPYDFMIELLHSDRYAPIYKALA